MTQEPFIQPRFVGPRFEGHTLPLSAAKDLAAYEKLVLELAKHLFREKQTDRVRVPKGFAQGFSLHIERIDDGSAMPALVAMMLGSLIADLPPEIIESKNLINTVIATEAEQAFPSAFPKEFYSYFNRIGCSLEDGEFIEWLPKSTTNKTVLTPAKRKRLVIAHRETYEKEVNVVGVVEELNAPKRTGTLRTQDKETVGFAYDDPFFADLKIALGSSSMHVRLKGVGIFDVNERLSAVKEIEQVDALAHYKLTSGIEALAALKDGWLEGNGVAPNNDHLNWLTNEVTKAFPESLEYPAVVPTEDGNVVFEWVRPQARIELEINFADKQLEIYATNLKTREFVEVTLNQNEWPSAFEEIARLLLA